MTYPPVPGDPNQYPPGDPNQYPTAPGQWQPITPQPQPPKKQNVLMFVIFGALAVLLIGGGVWAGLGFIGDDESRTKKAEAEAEAESDPEPDAEIDKGGFALGGGDPTVHIYLDFICPACSKFQADNGDTLAEAIDDEKATVVMHPLGFLDASSSTNYSTRAAAASACAADEDKFFDYYRVLMTNQPEEGGAGLSDDKLVELADEMGLGDSFAGCVEDETYIKWIRNTTGEAGSDGIASTPTVRINGKGVEVSEFGSEFADATGS